MTYLIDEAAKILGNYLNNSLIADGYTPAIKDKEAYRKIIDYTAEAGAMIAGNDRKQVIERLGARINALEARIESLEGQESPEPEAQETQTLLIEADDERTPKATIELKLYTEFTARVKVTEFDKLEIEIADALNNWLQTQLEAEIEALTAVDLKPKPMAGPIRLI